MYLGKFLMDSFWPPEIFEKLGRENVSFLKTDVQVDDTNVRISDRTPVWTAEQISAIVSLLKVKCKVNERGCTNEWCRAREAIKTAFGIWLAR